MISSKLSPRQLFDSQTTSFVNLLKTITPNSFQLPLELIQGTSDSNQLMSGLQTNYIPYSTWGNDSKIHIIKIAQEYGDTGAECYCDSTTLCIGKSNIFDLETLSTEVIIPNCVFVTNVWLNVLSSGAHSSPYYYLDIRYVGPSQFQALAIFCTLSMRTVDVARDQFYSTDFVSPKILPYGQFNSEVNTLLNLFKQTTPNTFTQTLDIITATTIGNQLLTSPSINWNTSLQDIGDSYYQLIPTLADYSDCSCSESSNCVQELGFYDDLDRQGIPTLEATITNFFTGCFPVAALLQSTLECFYNQTCFNTFIDYCVTNATSMNYSSLPSRFNIDTVIGDIVKELMIEQWNNETNYTDYYQQCTPSYCTYSIVKRKDILYIFTTLIALTGGLVTALKLLPPLVILLIRKINNRTKNNAVIDKNTEKRMMLSGRLRLIFDEIKEKLATLNTFESSSHDIEDVQYQRITTRWYIILFFGSAVILLFCTGLSTTMTTITVKSPSLPLYTNLQQSNISGLLCPCSRITVKYVTFLLFQPSYHPICKSDFITQQWFDTISSNDQITLNQFRIIASFCQLIEKTVNDSLTLLYVTDLLSPEAISYDTFTANVESIINSFESSTPNSFFRTLSLIRAITQSNQLMSVYETNYKFQPYSPDNDNLFYTSPVVYGTCNCALSSSCIETSNTSKYFYTGCYPLEALFQSTLECLYDSSCVPSTFTSLNSSSLSSRYAKNTTVENIINNFMIEQWNSSFNYSAYYEQCSPEYCTYSIIQQNDAVYIITVTIGIIGGLAKALKLFLPVVVWAVRKIKYFAMDSRVVPFTIHS
ncbi:unnamed protein product [Didymodactylos carnosus]|uniref:Uncharacterized protein n=1 Tax=Didymodactylos carnosus TaxID=1234261 RepID=A0A815G5L3_9BILA|nr:unnamed protein product [Didymodactylos carnosus]CAF4190274.1 unnamed protein product [Didymodactylos carnosus]